MKNTSLNVKAFALSGGILWGIGVIFLGIWANYDSNAIQIVNWIAQYYKGFNTTFSGAIIGGIWGFFDLAIGCLIFAWLYNLLNKKLS